MKVHEFLKAFGAESQRLVNHLPSFIDYIKQKERKYKYMREEQIPIKSYIRELNIDPNADIFFGEETEPWDAKIIDPHSKKETILEVTQALPQDAHKVRQERAKRINLDLNYLTLHQIGIDEFPDPIINVINKKIEMNYQDLRTLLVLVAGEYTEEDDYIITEWIKETKRQIHKNNFEEIYLSKWQEPSYLK